MLCQINNDFPIGV